MNKKYYYIFLTRDGQTSLPDQNDDEIDIDNCQYLGDLESDEELISEVVDKFYKNNEFLKDYKIDNLIIKRFESKYKTYYLKNN